MRIFQSWISFAQNVQLKSEASSFAGDGEVVSHEAHTYNSVCGFILFPASNPKRLAGGIGERPGQTGLFLCAEFGKSTPIPGLKPTVFAIREKTLACWHGQRRIQYMAPALTFTNNGRARSARLSAHDHDHRQVEIDPNASAPMIGDAVRSTQNVLNEYGTVSPAMGLTIA